MPGRLRGPGHYPERGIRRAGYRPVVRSRFLVVSVPPDRDPCVVDTAPLAALLEAFVRDWNRTRPSTAGQFTTNARHSRTEVTPIGAVTWLSAETRIPRRQIQRIIAVRYATTELRAADLLLIAIERPDELSPLTGSLAIRPNPNAPPAVRATCCGTPGLTGSF